jgi:hypothetical protein
MPYRYAHWMILALLPVIGLAFWRDYFGTFGGAPFAFHAHGLTATAWILLIGTQSWSIHARRNRWHRALGAAVLVVVPLFAGAAVLVVHSMATKFATGSHPFYAIFGARLGMHDIVTTITLVAMVAAGLRNRRVPALHGGYMLATVLLVIPPIMARLPIPVPPWLHFGEVLTILFCMAVWARRPATARPFLIVAGVMVSQIATFETIGQSPEWSRWFAALSRIDPAPWAVVAMLLAAGVLYAAWPRRRNARASSAAVQPAA